eukprot:NODE_866_length_1403_cov_99.806499_g721_i0.p1 GENE.NODE_866_length_1403_cov_99.806499_g721_i0~~NODE_866_length_1403_cov_99.806499_g721_i0.p1  ORF type:complete len:407 (+),score=151.14 NODE_866_length_1403_cov_99.806499_g721_i0:184-1221(+)
MAKGIQRRELEAGRWEAELAAREEALAQKTETDDSSRQARRRERSLRRRATELDEREKEMEEDERDLEQQREDLRLREDQVRKREEDLRLRTRAPVGQMPRSSTNKHPVDMDGPDEELETKSQLQAAEDSSESLQWRVSRLQQEVMDLTRENREKDEQLEDVRRQLLEQQEEAMGGAGEAVSGMDVEEVLSTLERKLARARKELQNRTQSCGVLQQRLDAARRQLVNEDPRPMLRSLIARLQDLPRAGRRKKTLCSIPDDESTEALWQAVWQAVEAAASRAGDASKRLKQAERQVQKSQREQTDSERPINGGASRCDGRGKVGEIHRLRGRSEVEGDVTDEGNDV